MIEYRPTHEMILVNWYLELLQDQREFQNLFTAPLRNLTEILFWAKHTVKLYYEADDRGAWMAVWYEPVMSGAYWGCWVRKDKRHSPRMLRNVEQSLDEGLRIFPVLMAPTKQVRLRKEMTRLGFVHQGDIPFLFDGAPAGVYYLTQETREAANSERRNRRYHAPSRVAARAADERESRDSRHSGLVLDSGEAVVHEEGQERERLRDSEEPDWWPAGMHASDDSPNEESSRPRKRGRPRQPKNQSSRSDANPEQSEPSPKTR